MLPDHSQQNIFQDRLNDLFETTGVTYRQVVKGTRGIVKETYLWQLRSGRARNPSYKVIAALACFFDVRPGYFFTGVKGGDNSSSDDMALLIAELDETGRRLIREVIRGILTPYQEIKQ
jgi:transcriptional regulator with XRE-family HTH domain